MATVVKAEPQDTNEQLIKKFKKEVQKDQVLEEVNKRRFYRPPSLEKKEKRAEIRRRQRSKPR